MNDFERRLKSLRLARPPEDLEEQIFGPKRTLGYSLKKLFQFPVRLGWAAAFSVAMGIAGTLIGQVLAAWNPAIDARPETTLVVEIVRTTAERPDFDFTDAPAEFLPGGLSDTVEIHEEG